MSLECTPAAANRGSFWDVLLGKYNLDRCDDTGTFDCPNCGDSRTFRFIRTYEYFHIWFIPLLKQGVVGEYVECAECSTQHSIAVLGHLAREIASAAGAANEAGISALEQFGNIVALAPEAAAEVTRRRDQGGYGDDVAVRIESEDDIQKVCRVGFDFPSADGRDWIGQSEGLTILIDRRDAEMMHGAVIQFRDGRFEWTNVGRETG